MFCLCHVNFHVQEIIIIVIGSITIVWLWSCLHCTLTGVMCDHIRHAVTRPNLSTVKATQLHTAGDKCQLRPPHITSAIWMCQSCLCHQDSQDPHSTTVKLITISWCQASCELVPTVMDGGPHLFYKLLLHFQAFTSASNYAAWWQGQKGKVRLQQCLTVLLLSQLLLKLNFSCGNFTHAGPRDVHVKCMPGSLPRSA